CMVLGPGKVGLPSFSLRVIRLWLCTDVQAQKPRSRFIFMSQNNLVSVTIVTYNSGRFIERCLESVLAQRYQYKEIIVRDNDSTDGSVDILERFEDRCTVVYN